MVIEDNLLTELNPNDKNWTADLQKLIGIFCPFTVCEDCRIRELCYLPNGKFRNIKLANAIEKVEIRIYWKESV